jgi:hypothetical protein
MKSWQDVSWGLEGARVRNLRVSDRRTYVVWADTDRGVMITRDGGMSWRPAAAESIEFPARRFSEWHEHGAAAFRVSETGELLRRVGDASAPAMSGWRIPRATSVFVTTSGVIAGGPGGVYSSQDGSKWSERNFWRSEETGPADFLHAYWMGRYYKFLNQ